MKEEAKPKRRSRLEATAHHEAAHAVVSWHLGIGLRKKGVTIVPTAEYRGLCTPRAGIGHNIEWDLSDRTRIKAEKKVQSLLAGEIAHRRYSPRSAWRCGASSDRHAAVDILTYFTYDSKELAAWLKLLRIRTENMLANPNVWRAVERLAAALLERRTIEGKEATEIIREGFNEALYSQHPEMRGWYDELRLRLNRPTTTGRRRGSAMSAEERYKALMLSFPSIEADFDEKGTLTDEGAARASDWALEQLSEAERSTLQKEFAERYRLKPATARLEQMVAEGKAEAFTNEAGERCYRMLEG